MTRWYATSLPVDSMAIWGLIDAGGTETIHRWGRNRRTMIIDIADNRTPSNRDRRKGRRLTDGFGSDDKDVFHVEFDGDPDLLSELIPRSVATILDRRPTDLTPLGDVVDTHMIEAMVNHGSSDRHKRGEFTFHYEGIAVTVETDGHLWLERL